MTTLIQSLIQAHIPVADYHDFQDMCRFYRPRPVFLRPLVCTACKPAATEAEPLRKH